MGLGGGRTDLVNATKKGKERRKGGEGGKGKKGDVERNKKKYSENGKTENGKKKRE